MDMNLEIIDKIKKCPDIILIDEKYCLDTSFDILQKDFNVLFNKVTQEQKIVEKCEQIIKRYKNNSEKYNKLMAYVSQFSGNWIQAEQTYNTYKDIWSTHKTPIEVIYPKVIDVDNWGVIENNKIIRRSKSASEANAMLNWVNKRYPVSSFISYNNLHVKLFFKQQEVIPVSATVKYKENCSPEIKTDKVCCKEDACKVNWPGGHGCNRSIINGHAHCADMFGWCPGVEVVTGFQGGYTVSRGEADTLKTEGLIFSKKQQAQFEKKDKGIQWTENCVEGICKGKKTRRIIRGDGSASYVPINTWTNELMEISHTLEDNRMLDETLVGFVIIKLVKSGNVWTE